MKHLVFYRANPARRAFVKSRGYYKCYVTAAAFLVRGSVVHGGLNRRYPFSLQYIMPCVRQCSASTSLIASAFSKTKSSYPEIQAQPHNLSCVRLTKEENKMAS